MAYETRPYEVIERDGAFELREYEPAVVAETRVRGEFEDVGSSAFRILFGYIGGANDESTKIAMTTPVTQEPVDEGYRVTFMMPTDRSLEELPQPSDGRVTLREEPESRFASVRYSGFWSRRNYQEHLAELESWLATRGLEKAGEPVWARYDPPFMPWFLRTNEILIPVRE